MSYSVQRDSDRVFLEVPGPAKDAVAPIKEGRAVTGLTKGQFSLIHLIRACLEITGPADLTVSTWTAGIRDAETAAWLLSSDQITSLTLLLDRSFPTRQPKYAAFVIKAFGPDSIRAANTHAKFAIIENSDWSLVIRSSMNLNKNPRFEQFDIDNSEEVASFFKKHLLSQPIGFDPKVVQRAYEAAMKPAQKDPYEKLRKKLERNAQVMAERQAKLEFQRKFGTDIDNIIGSDQ